MTKPETISKEWGEGAWLGWQWAVCGCSQVDLARWLDISPSKPCLSISRFIREWSGKNDISGCYEGARKALLIKALESYINAGGILIQPEGRNRPWGRSPNKSFIDVYGHARAEHAFLLRCEGMTYKEMGVRLGMSNTGAQQLQIKFARQMRKAMRRTKFSIKEV